jgi:hypothetical protein
MQTITRTGISWNHPATVQAVLLTSTLFAGVEIFDPLNILVRSEWSKRHRVLERAQWCGSPWLAEIHILPKPSSIFTGRDKMEKAISDRWQRLCCATGWIEDQRPMCIPGFNRFFSIASVMRNFGVE